MVDIIDNCCLTEIRIIWQEQSSVVSANHKPITLLRESKFYYTESVPTGHSQASHAIKYLLDIHVCKS